ncbi:hypothetical protein NDA13_001542 [Ustilago tritici]|nr:hypothetical protein NDA13_001542 [Ustilago tritici]
MAPSRVTGSAACHGPFKAKAQAAAASSKATAPAVPAHKGKGKPRHSAMADVANYLNLFNRNIFDVEDVAWSRLHPSIPQPGGCQRSRA